MTVLTTSNRRSHVPDGINDTFSYNFRVDSIDDMSVYVDGVLYEEPFSMTGLGEVAGGNVVFDAAPSGDINDLTLIRIVEIVQGTTYPVLGPFPAPTNELNLDYLTWICQQLSEEIGRALLTPVDVGDTSYEMPVYASGEYWRWDIGEERIVTATLASIGAASVGVDVGDLFELINVGGSAGLPAIVGDDLLVGGSALGDSVAQYTLAEIVDGGLAFPAGFTGTSLAASPNAGWLEQDGSARSMTVYSDLHASLDGMSGLNTGETFTTTFGTDIITDAAHGQIDGNVIRFTTSGGDLPDPLAIDTNYFVRDATTNTFKVALTLGGTAIDLTDNGTGTHTYHDEFLLPDPRGMFPRYWDHGAGVDPDAAGRTDRGDGITGDNNATEQADDVEAHTHNITQKSTYFNNIGSLSSYPSMYNNLSADSGSFGGSTETRPINRYEMPVIKY